MGLWQLCFTRMLLDCDPRQQLRLGWVIASQPCQLSLLSLCSR